MKGFFLIATLFIVLSAGRADCQSVKFSKPDHIAPNDKLSIEIGAPLDSSGKSAEISGVFYLINSAKPLTKTLELNADNNRIKDPFIIRNETLQAGISSFFLSFPDTSERVYTAIISNSLKGKKTKNLFERIAFQSDAGFYDSFSAKIVAKVSQGDSATIMKDLPKGFKCIVAMDFFTLSKDGFRKKDATIYCVVSQYKLGEPDNGASIENVIRDSFLEEKNDSPLYGLLSTNWLLGPESFSGDFKSIELELLNNGNYTPYKPTNKNIMEKILVGTCDASDNFRRVIIFINN